MKSYHKTKLRLLKLSKNWTQSGNLDTLVYSMQSIVLRYHVVKLTVFEATLHLYNQDSIDGVENPFYKFRKILLTFFSNNPISIIESNNFIRLFQELFLYF